MARCQARSHRVRREVFNEGVWEQARVHGYVIITKDFDFSDAQRHPGPPPQAVRLTLGNSTPAELEAYLREHAAEIEQFAESAERYREI